MTDNTNANDLIELIKEDFTTGERERFYNHFKIYLVYGENNTEFVIDLDDTWEWMGFFSKGNANRALKKYFEENIDYRVENMLCTSAKQHGGHNKETIRMTINTFKSLCMLSNSKKGKETRKYYLQLEKCFLKYMKEKHEETILSMKKETTHKLEMQHHNDLINAHKDKPCVYIVKIPNDINDDTKNDNDIVVKLGETDDISQRIITLQYEYKVKCVLLDIFPCERPHKFEQYLLNVPDIKKHRIISTELIQLSSEFKYTDLVKIIHKNIGYFDSTPIEHQLEMARNREISGFMNLLSQATSEEEKTRYLNLIEHLRYNTHFTKKYSHEKEEYKEPISHRKVFKYSLDDLSNPIEEYTSLREAARSLDNTSVHDYTIRDACTTNKVLYGYRWYYVDSEDGITFNKPDTIPPTQVEDETKTKQKRRQGLIAQLNPYRSMILNVYESLKDAATAHDVAACSITCAMHKDRMCNKFYWKMYEDCDDTLKATFTGIVPNTKKPRTCSKQIQRIDPDTLEVLETFMCIQDICTKYRMCHKTVNTITKSGDIYKGYKWAVVKKNDIVV